MGCQRFSANVDKNLQLHEHLLIKIVNVRQRLLNGPCGEELFFLSQKLDSVSLLNVESFYNEAAMCCLH